MLVSGGVTFVKKRRIHLNLKEGKEQCAVKIHGIEAWVFYRLNGHPSCSNGNPSCSISITSTWCVILVRIYIYISDLYLLSWVVFYPLLGRKFSTHLPRMFVTVNLTSTHLEPFTNIEISPNNFVLNPAISAKKKMFLQP